MRHGTDLTQGPIVSKLIKLSLPIIGTSFIQMAYNLTDVIWLGRTGAEAVTAVTTAGFFLWLLMAIFNCTKTGTEALVSRAVGRKDPDQARQVSQNALTLSIYASVLLNLLIFVFAAALLRFFTLEPGVMDQAVTYLKIVSWGMCFAVICPVLSAVHIGFGNSKTPFIINSLGLGVNMILDPLLIFGFGYIPALGSAGAAMATVIANTLVFCIFIFKINSPGSVVPGLRLFTPLIPKTCKAILQIGVPIAAHSVAFCLFSMGIGRIVSAYGTIPLGVQNVGAGIEALSWNTALGFSTALGAFTGQNYGAGRIDRIIKGYGVIVLLSVSLGLIATIAFYFFGEEVFSLFTTDQQMLDTGILYLKILAISQIFMCIEITSAGGFYGLGRSKPPSAISIIFTGLRIPAALIVVNTTALGYAGVWWCISISSVFKGVLVAGLFCLVLKKMPSATLPGANL